MKSINLISQTEDETVVECSHCWNIFVLEDVKVRNHDWIKTTILFSCECPICNKDLFAFTFDESWD